MLLQVRLIRIVTVLHIYRCQVIPVAKPITRKRGEDGVICRQNLEVGKETWGTWVQAFRYDAVSGTHTVIALRVRSENIGKNEHGV